MALPVELSPHAAIDLEVFLGNYRIIYRVEQARVLILKLIEGHKPLRRR